MAEETQANKISGRIRRVLFQRDGFLAAVLDDGTKIAGEMHAEPDTARVYVFEGEWNIHPRFGHQFKFKGFDVEVPRGRAAVADYLKDTCSFLGPVRVARLMDAFGDDAIEVMKADPGRAAAVAGISHQQAAVVANQLLKLEKDQVLEIGVRTLFDGVRVRNSLRAIVIQTWGHEACDVIRQNPFILLQFDGVGFFTADQIARKVGFPHDGSERIQAGILHTLKEVTSDGHCFLDRAGLLQGASKLLGLGTERVAEEIEPMARYAKLTIDGDAIYLPKIHAAEQIVAQDLSERARVSATNPGANFEGLAEDQQKALDVILGSRLSLLTGPPGTGKSFTLDRVIAAFPSDRIAVCAPTGKAARRIKELTGWDAVTIHRLLEPKMEAFGFVFTRNRFNPLEQNVVVVDEVSMVPITLMASLVEALRPEARLILTGDPDQLPSVGPGAVLRDLMSARVVAHAQLTEIKRQAAGSKIIHACHAIRAGNAPDVANAADDDFFVLQDADMQGIARTVVDLVYNRLPARYALDPSGKLVRNGEVEGKALDPLEDIQVITAHRDKTLLSSKALNGALQSRRLERDGQAWNEKQRFYVGDKVMQTVNGMFTDDESGDAVFVANGDIGLVTEHERGFMTVQFESPKRVVRFKAGDNDLQLAYAVTVHKFQGSQAPCIVIPVHRSSSPLLLQRSWLYTAVSRAARLCVLVGDRSEIDRCVARSRQDMRRTRLKDLIRDKALA